MICELCPNRCSVDRDTGHGKCGLNNEIKIARAGLHMWEEPVLVGKNGSGTVFFSGCTLRCAFCQNHNISEGCFGQIISPERLSEIFLSLQAQGAENINLVSPTPHVHGILKALEHCSDSLNIPIVYNCGGYELCNTVNIMASKISIYMPDFKYYSNELGEKYSGARNYREHAAECIEHMLQLQSHAVVENGVMKKGVIIRHLVLPSHKKDSIELLHFIADRFGTKGYFLSLMRQYTPCHRASEHPEINRKLTTYEYNCVAHEAEKLGFDGFLQEKGSDNSSYTPKFDLTGV